MDEPKASKKEEKKASLSLNLIFSFLSQSVGYLTPLILAPHISRALGADGVGEYGYAASLVFYFSNAVAFGFSSLGIKSIAARRNDKKSYSEYFWTLVTIRLFFFLVFGGLYLGLVLGGVLGPTIHMGVKLALLMVLIANAIEVAFLFQGLENFRIVSYIQLLGNAIYMVCVFLFVKTEEDVALYTLFKSSVSVFLHVILWILAIPKLSKPSFSKKEVWPILRGGFEFFLPTVAIGIGPQLDQTMLGLFAGNAEVGYYQQASKLTSIATGLINAISPVMLSRISFLYQQGKKEEAKEKLSSGINLALLLALPCAAGLYLIASRFVPLFFGEEFLPAVDVLYFLIPAALLSPISSILINSYFYPAGKVNLSTAMIFGAVLGNSVMTFLLVKIGGMGAKGAALGTDLAEVILLVGLTILGRKAIGFRKILKDCWKSLLSTAAMTGLLVLVNHFLTIGPVYVIVIDVFSGIVIYFGVALLLREETMKKGIGMLSSLKRPKKENK